MPKINELTEQRILAAARVTDILADMGVQLHQQGANLTALCPFHEDRNLGSFMVSESRNICTCYACGTGAMNPKTLLAKWKGWDLKKDYPKILRYLAAMYSIYIDDEPAPQVKRAEPRPAPQPLPMVVFPNTVMRPSLGHSQDNTLLTYLLSLPLCPEDKARLQLMIGLYAIGTSTNGDTRGWTIFWQIDIERRIRTGKLMAYLPNGHRDKERKYNFNWIHSMLAKAGMIDLTTQRAETCLFGEHLVDAFPKAEICLVESEKSALICSSFIDPDKRLWLATAGKSGLSRQKLQPLIDLHRDIVIYPDKDGYQEWQQMAEMIAYPRLFVSDLVQREWQPCDGDKADIADIMLRRLLTPTPPTAEPSESDRLANQLARHLLAPDKAEDLQYLIDQLDLQLCKTF